MPGPPDGKPKGKGSEKDGETNKRNGWSALGLHYHWSWAGGVARGGGALYPYSTRRYRSGIPPKVIAYSVFLCRHRARGHPPSPRGHSQSRFLSRECTIPCRGLRWYKIYVKCYNDAMLLDDAQCPLRLLLACILVRSRCHTALIRAQRGTLHGLSFHLMLPLLIVP